MEPGRGPNWNRVLDGLVDNSTNALHEVKFADLLLETLEKASSSGVSFTELQSNLTWNPSTLTAALVKLQRAGLIENVLERREERRVYSFYRLTSLSRVFRAEFTGFKTSLRASIAAHSENPGLQASRRILRNVTYLRAPQMEPMLFASYSVEHLKPELIELESGLVAAAQFHVLPRHRREVPELKAAAQLHAHPRYQREYSSTYGSELRPRGSPHPFELLSGFLEG